MPNTPKKQIPVAGLKHVKLENVIPEDLPLNYSDNMLVQNRDGLFTLFFMQNQNPVLLTQSEVQAVKSVKSKCVAKVLVGPYQLARNIKALEENFKKFLEVSTLDVKDHLEFIAYIEAKNPVTSEDGAQEDIVNESTH